MWVYIQTEAQLWTVGFYTPEGKWMTDSDHSTKTGAAARVNYLNGERLTDADKRLILANDEACGLPYLQLPKDVLAKLSQ